MKVLIVDDSSAHRSRLRKLLEELGNEVTEASSGSEAIDVFQALRPDIVALDRVMPEMNGVSTLMRLRQVDPAVKVVMISSHATVSEMLEAREAGASGFIMKPLQKEKVKEAISKLEHKEKLE